MSEEAKPVCWDCQQPITDEFPGVSRTHTTEGVCKRALRAALDQERARVAALRETVEACGEWSPNSRGKLIFHFGDRWIADDETLALLSGRGEVDSALGSAAGRE